MRPLTFILLAAVLSLFAYIFHLAYYEPYVLLPDRDKFFLELRPTREEVIAQFGTPNEQLGPGDRFQATGWYPLPKKPASHTALSFIRIYSSKIYVYFDSRKNVTEWMVSQR